MMSEGNKSSFDEERSKSSKKGKLNMLPFKVILLLGVIGIGLGVYFYIQYDKSQKLKDPVQAAKHEKEGLIEKVGKLMLLPKDEEPTIATVSDVTKLKDQQFFAKAQNGFKVLIYAKNKKAILYDPVANRIVEVGPINIDQKAQEASPSTVIENINIALYNGTKIVGLASSVEKELKQKASNVTVVTKANARADYKKTLVIDLSADEAGLAGKHKDAAAQLAKVLNGEVSRLPDGEIKASGSADLLVIIGR